MKIWIKYELTLQLATVCVESWLSVSSHDVRPIDLKWWDRETMVYPLSASINQSKESLFNIATQLDIFSLMLTKGRLQILIAIKWLMVCYDWKINPQ